MLYIHFDHVSYIVISHKNYICTSIKFLFNPHYFCLDADTVRVLTITFPITVIITAVVASILSSIITYCCCVRTTRSYGVNTLSVTNRPAAADYETPMKSSELEMKDNMAYGHVSVTTSTGTSAVVYVSVQS